MGNRIHELLHGILVGHVYYYFVHVVPTLTNNNIVRTPQLLSQLLGGDAYRTQDPIIRRNNNNNPQRRQQQQLRRRFQQDGSTAAHIAAKVGDLDALRNIS
eukprot:CAMPEP_0194198024 /NCGR_PEP_ID=MMETSP0154-20130528/77533_1 /TAXON_ID=1049557 /ORGANISM="Thalassiothrix antarctica, Strain L6-D1" /LENGTH=100 /DNA_ID=CAMNT_0038922765 /DNA_START=525 /DNA_END=824 /DNA_ORIENTATION=-